MDPHPQRLNDCADEIARNAENLLDLFDNIPLIDLDLVIFERVKSAIASAFNLKQQADYTVGHLIGYLEGEIKDRESLGTLLGTLEGKIKDMGRLDTLLDTLGGKIKDVESLVHRLRHRR